MSVSIVQGSDHYILAEALFPTWDIVVYAKEYAPPMEPAMFTWRLSQITTVPDLPGCMADGKTPEEAIKNTQEVIAVWLECAEEDGEPIPQPSDQAVTA